MAVNRPDELLDSGFIIFGEDGWELKEGAPENIKKQFEEFMKDLEEEAQDKE